MSEISVRTLGAEDWEQFRTARLRALRESPEAFVATHDDEEKEPETFWRERMERSRRLLAERDKETVGVVSVGSTDEERVAELFGLWVTPDQRSRGVATALVKAGAQAAAEDGKKLLRYWVGTENARAVGFASGYGFRPTSDRRPMRVDDGESQEEIAMELPLEI